jgi:excisionase family DNA binding protein
MVERLAYTVAEACEALRVGRTKLYELLAARKLEAVALDGRTLILREEILRLLAELPPISLQMRSSLGAGSFVGRPDQPLRQHAAGQERVPARPLGASGGESGAGVDCVGAPHSGGPQHREVFRPDQPRQPDVAFGQTGGRSAHPEAGKTARIEARGADLKRQTVTPARTTAEAD